jgi:hypothetical protein
VYEKYLGVLQRRIFDQNTGEQTAGSHKPVVTEDGVNPQAVTITPDCDRYNAAFIK